MKAVAAAKVKVSLSPKPTSEKNQSIFENNVN